MSESMRGVPPAEQQLKTFEDHSLTLRAVSPLTLARQEVRLGYQWSKKLITEKRAGEMPSVKRKLHEIFDGKTGSEVLQNKFLFGNLVRSLGYQAPESVLVLSGAEQEDLLSQVDALDTKDDKRFCKPLGGNCGKGVYIAANAEDAVAFVQDQEQDYLIQTLEAPQQDWRYILHRDNSQLQPATIPGWRMAFDKVRPKVTGDGASSVTQLVQGDEVIPDYAKEYFFAYQEKIQSNIPNDIPAPGEQIELCDSGNVGKGAYVRKPEEHEIQVLDRFMLQFFQDLEERLGSPVNTFCVDIGVRDASLFDQPYDFEKMKSNVVFYEFQLPFSNDDVFEDYPKEGSREGFARLVPNKLYRASKRRRLEWDILKSLLVTGALTQKADRERTVYERTN